MREKFSGKKKRVVILIVCGVVLAGAALGIWLSRPAPGHLFRIAPGNVSHILLGVEGNMEKALVLDDPEQVAQAVAQLNNFTYSTVEQEPRPAGSVALCLEVVRKVGFGTSVYFDGDRVYRNGRTSDSTAYVGQEGSLSGLAELARETLGGQSPCQIDPSGVTLLTLYHNTESREITNPRQVTELVELLNGFPAESQEAGESGEGWEYRLDVEGKEPLQVRFTDSQLCLRQEDGGDVVYTGPQGYFQDLVEMAETGKGMDPFPFDWDQVESASLVHLTQGEVEVDPAWLEEILQDFTCESADTSPMTVGWTYNLELNLQGGTSLVYTLSPDQILYRDEERQTTTVYRSPGFFQPLIQRMREELPFLFNIDPETVTAVELREPAFFTTLTVTDREGIEEIVEGLNNFTYEDTEPLSQDLGGPRFQVTLKTADGDGQVIALSEAGVEDGQLYRGVSPESAFTFLIAQAQPRPPFALEADQVEALAIETQETGYRELPQEQWAQVVELLNGFAPGEPTRSNEMDGDGSLYLTLNQEGNTLETQLFFTQNALIFWDLEDLEGGAFVYQGPDGYFAPLLALAS